MPRPRTNDQREPGTAARRTSISATDVDTTDWPAQAADTIERVVQGVRDKTTGPAINAARWVVAGLFGLLVGTTVVILVVIALVRFVDVYLPDSVFGEQHMWVAYALVGLPLVIAGLLMMRQRSTRDDA